VHYEKFVQRAERNQKITRIPTDGELEENGFSITDLYYLVLPNGLQVNPETVDPTTDLFDDGIKGLFLCNDDPLKESSTQTRTVHTPDSKQPTKVCVHCGKNKSVEEFKKRVGRGGGREPVCIQCKSDVKEEIVDDFTKDQIHIVDGRSGHIKKYVSYEDVKRLVREAYDRGKKDQAVNVDAVTPSLDELLEIGA
jgi:hypothetical protein